MAADSHDSFLARLDQRLEERADGAAAAALGDLLAHLDCAVGTYHRWDAGRNGLVLVADHGLPTPVRDKVRMVPIGKGMAGIAAERRTPVQVCNLQEDASGVVRPGAKLTQMEGSVACPVLVDGELVAVIGVAKPVAYDFTASEIAVVTAVGERLARAGA